jgi:hypothetical protein
MEVAVVLISASQVADNRHEPSYPYPNSFETIPLSVKIGSRKEGMQKHQSGVIVF